MQTPTDSCAFSHTQTWTPVHTLNHIGMSTHSCRSPISRQRPRPATLTPGLLCSVGSSCRMLAALWQRVPPPLPPAPLPVSSSLPLYCSAFPPGAVPGRGNANHRDRTVSTCSHPCSPPPKAISDSAEQREEACCAARVRQGGRNEWGDSWSVKRTPAKWLPIPAATHKMHIIAFSTVGWIEIQKVKSRIGPIISFLSSVRRLKSIFMHWVARVWGRLFQRWLCVPSLRCACRGDWIHMEQVTSRCSTKLCLWIGLNGLLGRQLR